MSIDTSAMQNGEQEMRLGEKPFIVIEWDAATWDFRVIRGGNAPIPNNELIGVLQRLVVGTCMQANMEAMAKAAQQQSRGVEVAQAMPPEPKFQKAR